MKLMKCYVSSFGNLKDVSFDFNSNLTVFNEENGWGKSTLASFIKCIFYGIRDGKRSVAENERTRFKPWNSTEKFGGYVEFEWGSNKYKLERFFGNKSSEDTITLIDLTTGKNFQSTENLGERIFKIDEDGFLSTTYFSQKDFQAKSNTSITAKFNSMFEVQDNQAFDKALQVLEKKSKFYKMTGDKGAIADTKREIYRVEEHIQQVKLAKSTADSLKISADSLEKEVNQLKNEVNLLADKVAETGKIEANLLKKKQYESLIVKKEQLLAKKAQLAFILNGNFVDEGVISTYIKCNDELNKIQDRISYLEKDVSRLSETTETNSSKKKVGKKQIYIAVAGGIALFVAILFSVILGSFLKPVPIFSSIIFVLLELTALITSFLDKDKNQKPNSQLINLYNTAVFELNESKETATQYSQKIDEFLSYFNIENFVDRTSALAFIQKVLLERDEVEKNLLEIDGSIAYLGDKNDFLNVDKNFVDINALKEKLESLQEKYTSKARELANKRSEINFLINKADALGALEEKHSELVELLKRYKEEFEIVKLTIDYFKKADENLKIKYREPLQNSLNKFLSYIDDGKTTAFIDIDLNITVQEKGSDKVTDYYSKGYQNLFEICKRFALTEVLFKEEKPFIILDDPFYNLDEKKIKNAIELIKKLSSEYQIIYFICHESRSV